MKMDISVVTLVFGLLMFDPSQQCDYYVASGGKATLPMTFALDQSDKLTWMHGMKTILRQTKDKFTSEGKDIVTANGSLTWANVAQSNAGAYKAEVHDRDGKSRWASKSTRLCVIDPVPKPTVTHECKQTEVKFTCHVQPKAEGFDFEWLQNNQVLDTEKGQTLTRPGDQVTGSITCKLSNRVSSATSEAVHQTCYNPVPKPTVTHECKQTEVKFTCKVQSKAEGFDFEWLQENQVLDTEKGQTLTRPGDQVTGPITCKLSNRVSSATSEAVHQTCYTPIFQGKLFGIETWIVVATGGGVVLLLIIGVIVCCVCSKRKKRLHLEEEEELRLAWTNEKQQHPQHHHRPDQQPHCQHREPQQQPAGHTGPRQHRSRQQRPGAPEQPRPSPRRPAQAPRPPGQNEEEQPPPLPQPRTRGFIVIVIHCGLLS